MVASASPPASTAMEIKDQISPATKARPTQSYYVPRAVAESKAESKPEKKETSPKEKEPKKNPGAQLYTPPHSRNNQAQMAPTASKPRPLMDIQIEKIEKVSLFAPSPPSSESSRKSPDVENRRRNQRKQSGEKREELFPKIISVPSSSSSGPSGSRKAATPPRDGFSANLCPPPPTPAVKDGCICEREKTHVACKRCGYECSGRLALVCPLHPMQMNLMDLTNCPNPLCHSVQLYEVARR